jgi:hypothetical protein
VSDTAIYDAAGGVLAAAADALAGIGITPVAYVSHGDPAADCNQLTVQWTGVDQEPISANARPPRRAPAVLTFGFALVRWQCVPAPREAQASGKILLPTPTEMDASAKQLATEMWVTLNALRAAARAGTVLPGDCMLAQITTARPLNPEGALGGWVITGTAQIEGTTEP